MRLSIHGCRGSIPSCSNDTVRYGGNTSCYELNFGDFQVFFDTGSGFRTVKFGKDKTKICLYSHWHHDHIQGLPFNADIFNPANEFTICSALSTKRPLRHTLQTYFSGGYFPVDIITMLKNLNFANISELQQGFGDQFKLDWLELNHPGGAACYSVLHDCRKFCYLCDNEYEDDQSDRLLEFCLNADVVVWDGMFTQAELGAKKGWGHSSIEQGIRFFEHSGIGRLVIGHHAPSRTDAQLDDLANYLPTGVSFAMDGMEVEI